MATQLIRIGGAREHNLKDLTLDIPRERLVVITGLSGSGKSSLAFDTIFAEGQRKYVESLSPYARQFLDQLQKPDADHIEGLSPAIAIEQRSAGTNPRSIIATTTEIYDYLRLLFAHAGQPHCPETGAVITRQTASEIVDEILSLPHRSRVMLLAPLVEGEQGEFRDVFDRLAREGFVRARIDDEIVELTADQRVRLDPNARHDIEVVVDRLIIDDKARARLSDSLETALKWGNERVLLLCQSPEQARSDPWREVRYSTRYVSHGTGRTFEPPTPKHFSFNSPVGACPECQGLGQKLVFDPDLVVPQPEKSLNQKAIAPWQRGTSRMVTYYDTLLRGLADYYQASLDTPFRDLPSAFREVVLWGSGKQKIPLRMKRSGKEVTVRKPFEGVIPNLMRLYEETESETTRNRLKAVMSLQKCDVCHGARLKPEMLSVTLSTKSSGPDIFKNSPTPDAKADLEAAPDTKPHSTANESPSPSSEAIKPPGNRFVPHPDIPGLSIMDVCSLSVEDAKVFFGQLELSSFARQIASELIEAIRRRLQFLNNVGLGYLTLDRESGTLSGGEAQRIRLATQIGSGLVGVLYILDEPTIGLHQRDNERLLKTLTDLRDLGNSVLVVEHDEDTIRRADYLIDLGVGAGIHGGELVAAGTVDEVMANPKSLTGKYLKKEYTIPVPKKRFSPQGEQFWLTIWKARENNLRGVTVRFPLGCLTCVTGVSGSGKSTLVNDILCRALFRQFYRSKERPGTHDAITGTEWLDKVVVIDQTPIGRTPRSNPATYTGMFNHIRDLFARLPAAKIRGYGTGRFSFNVKGGRCEKCHGDGVIKIEMHFLPPVYATCEMCNGRRYNRETLEITYKGKNIADVLDMTVEEAAVFFRAVPSIQQTCQTLAEVGLGYVKLGQSGTTLSGGEAQRVKLAAELSRKSTGKTVYILDEPTTGLHFHDVAKLLEVLFKLRSAGNTLIIIEHHLDVIKTADWIVDLGPGGGVHGGEVVATGPPETVSKAERSDTARYLRPLLQET